MTLHLDDDLTSRYAKGETNSHESEVVATHLAECDACRELIAELARGKRSSEQTIGDPLSGLTIGRYLLAERLGSGAHSVVYRAHDPVLDRSVALKLLRNLDRGPLREQLIAAARAMARLDHRNVLPVFDAGEDGDEVFITSAIAEQGDLRGYLETKPTSKELILGFSELADGLAAIHAAGLTHRDIKPDNILVDKAHRLLLADIGHTGTECDSPGAVTPAYLPPEVATGAEFSERGDQYALAVTACEALTGTRPASVADAILALRRAKIPKRAARAIARALASDPSNRFPDATSFGSALHPGSSTGIALALGVSALVVGTLVFAFWPSSQQAQACAEVVESTTSRWQSLRPALGERFVSQPARWSQLAGHLDQYFSEMQSLRISMCSEVSQDTAGAHAQVACLSTRAEAAAGLLSALQAISADALPEGGVGSLLTPVSSCEKGKPYTAPAIPSEIVVESMMLQAELAQARSLATLGDYETAARNGKAALEAAKELDAKAAIAEAYLLLASVSEQQGHRREALDAFERAAQAAEESGDDRLRATALMGQFLTTDNGEAGKDLARRAEAVVTRTEDLELRSLFLSRRAIFRLRANRIDEGLEDLEEARVIAVDLFGANSSQLLSIEGNLAAGYLFAGRPEESQALNLSLLVRERDLYGHEHVKVARRLGAIAGSLDHAEGIAMLKEALGIFRSNFGDANPDTIKALTNLCATETNQGVKGISTYCAEAVAATALLHGEESPELAWPLTALGLAHLGVEAWADAERALERGLRLAAVPPRYPNELADLRYYLAVSLAKQEKQLPRALSLTKQARAVWLDSPQRKGHVVGTDELISELERVLKK